MELFVKDLGIALEESERMGIKLPGTARATQLYESLVEQGDGKLGIQSLLKALEKL